MQLNGSDRSEADHDFPNFTDVAPVTWRTLEACARDASFVEDAQDAIYGRARSQAQSHAAPALAIAFRTDARFAEAIGDADPDHLAGLLVALINASMMADVYAELDEPIPHSEKA